MACHREPDSPALAHPAADERGFLGRLSRGDGSNQRSHRGRRQAESPGDLLRRAAALRSSRTRSIVSGFVMTGIVSRVPSRCITTRWCMGSADRFPCGDGLGVRLEAVAISKQPLDQPTRSLGRLPGQAPASEAVMGRLCPLISARNVSLRVSENGRLVAVGNRLVRFTAASVLEHHLK